MGQERYATLQRKASVFPRQAGHMEINYMWIGLYIADIFVV
jgi:hypothetical protein